MTSKNARRRTRRVRATTRQRTTKRQNTAPETSTETTTDESIAWLVPQQLPWLQAS